MDLLVTPRGPSPPPAPCAGAGAAGGSEGGREGAGGGGTRAVGGVQDGFKAGESKQEAMLEADLVCVICHGILEDPLRVRGCGHAFCAVCLARWVSKAGLKGGCPTCRHTFGSDSARRGGGDGAAGWAGDAERAAAAASSSSPSMAEEGCVSEGGSQGTDAEASLEPPRPNSFDAATVRDEGLASRVSNLRVRCEGCAGGCAWSGLVRDYPAHAAKCGLIPETARAPGGSGSAAARGPERVVGGVVLEQACYGHEDFVVGETVVVGRSDGTRRYALVKTLIPKPGLVELGHVWHGANVIVSGTLERPIANKSGFLLAALGKLTCRCKVKTPLTARGGAPPRRVFTPGGISNEMEASRIESGSGPEVLGVNGRRMP